MNPAAPSILSTPAHERWLALMAEWGKGGPMVDIEAFPWREDEDVTGFMASWTTRERFVRQFGFAVPNGAFVRAVRDMGLLLEVGAGTGFLARLVASAGGDIRATDPDSGEHGWETERFFPVEPLQATAALARYPGRTVLMAWPTLGHGWAADVLAGMTPGQRLVYIGEGRGGCTADERFFECLEAFEEHPALPWHPFPGLHDKARVFSCR